MKIKLKPHAEYVLITIGYLENLVKHDPDFKKRAAKQIGVEAPKSVYTEADSIIYVMTILRSMIEFRDLNYSQPITKFNYFRKALQGLHFMEANYLNNPKARIGEADREQIIAAVKQFYRRAKTRFALGFGNFNATQDDRIAQISLLTFIAFAASGMISKLSDSSHRIETSERESELLNFDDLYQYLLNDPEIRQSLNKKKALETDAIRQIYNDFNTLLPDFSEDRKYMVTGYAAISLGVMSIADYNKETSSYESVNRFIKSRVKGVITST